MSKSSDPHWMEKATANSHGQFKAKAKAAGKSTGAYADQMASKGGKTGKQARLAKTLMKSNPFAKARGKV